MKTLHCVLKKEWFEKIKSGEKTHEYREYKPYWTQRLGLFIRKPNFIKECKIDGFPILIFLRNGYQKEAPEMLFEVKSITVVDGKNTDLAIDKPVYDIELGERLE